MRILITGATGFVGGHLAEALLADAGVELHGAARSGQWPGPLHHLQGRAVLHTVDLTDTAGVDALLRAVEPEQIYHLAGYAATGQSFHEPDAAWRDNLTAARTLYDAIARWGGRPRILHVSSALIYSLPEQREQSIDESAPLAPLSPYAASKSAADLLAYQVTQYPGLDVVRVRPFNQIGPRQSPQFAVASFARQLARIELGLAPPRLETGDLSARRDLTDVRDMVRAYRLLMEHGVRGEAYNAGSGTSVSMAEIVDLLRAECRDSVEVVTQPERLRPADVPALVADAAKLRRATGWAAQIPLRQSLRDTLDFWRHAEQI